MGTVRAGGVYKEGGTGGMRQGVATTGLSAFVLGALLAAGCSESAVEKVKSPDQAKRLEGLQELARQDTPEALTLAREVIAHEDVTTARAAVRTVSRMSRRSAVSVLARVAAEEKRPQVREEAVLALSYGREPSSADELRQVLRTDADPRVRAAAATGLGRIGNLSDVEFLLEVADKDTEPLVQSHAVGALDRLLGIGFTFDASAPAEDRQVTLRLIRQAAMIRAQVLRARATGAQAKAGGP